MMKKTFLYSITAVVLAVALSFSAFAADTDNLNYAVKLKNTDDWQTSIADPLVADEYVFVAAGNTVKYISSDGKTVLSGKLPSYIDFNCRPILAGNNIIIPLMDADIVAVNKNTLLPVWHTEPVITDGDDGKKQYHAIQSSMAYDGKNIYVPTVCLNSSYEPVRGEIICINPENGETVWNYDNTSSGYYWAGIAFADGRLVIGSADGKITVHSSDSGKVISSVNIGSGINSGVVYSDNACYTVSKDGVFHKFAINKDGVITEKNSVKFAFSSTSTPAIVGNKAYAGGLFEQSTDWANPSNGIICEIDIENMKLLSSVKTPAEVKCSVLADSESDTAYFTCNNFPGAVYSLKKGVVAPIYTPVGEQSNYCISSPVFDDKGNIIYFNDSGYLFSLSDSNITAVKGDINQDGRVTSSDARTALRISLKLETPMANILDVADMNNDEKITTADARIILRVALKLQ